ncbi:MAG: hypothetical protein K0R84_489 [Clostridia bacterium]|nr:hypothetical protein [Clostridia bacterium]
MGLAYDVWYNLKYFPGNILFLSVADESEIFQEDHKYVCITYISHYYDKTMRLITAYIYNIILDKIWYLIHNVIYI